MTDRAAKILELALNGIDNRTIADLVGVRPRRVREVVSAAIKAATPIAPNGSRTASGIDRNAPPAPDRPWPLSDSPRAWRPS